MATVVITPGQPWTPDKCKLCGSKVPPHPAYLTIERDGGSSTLTICARCDVATTALAKLIGTKPAHFRVDAGDGAATIQAEFELDGEDAYDLDDETDIQDVEAIFTPDTSVPRDRADVDHDEARPRRLSGRNGRALPAPVEV